MRGRVQFTGVVGGRLNKYPSNYYYGYGYDYYYPNCKSYDCPNRGGLIRFWGTKTLKANNGKRAELLGGTLTMERSGSWRNAIGKYTGSIFAVFKANGTEYVRWGQVSV